MTNHYILLDSYLDIIQIDEHIILNEGLSLNVIKNRYLKFNKSARKILKGHGISVSKLEAQGKKIGKGLRKQYDQGKTPKEVAKSLSSQLSKVTSDSIKPLLKQAKATGKAVSMYNPVEKVIVTVSMFIILIMIQSVIAIPLSITFGPQIAFLIAVIILAPIFEEAIKTYFITAGMPWSGTSMLFGYELVSYVIRMVSMGYALPTAILVRVISLGMHFSTTYIQKLIIDKGENEIDKTKYLFSGWICGVAIHMTWNTLAYVFEKDISKIIS